MTPKTETEPTLEDVAVLETRLLDLDVEANELGEREQQLNKQIEDIHTGAGSKKDLPGLTQQRREAREERADVLDAHTALQTRIRRDLELASTGAAGQRLKDINKAYGSLCRALKNDEVAVEKAAEEYKAMVAQVNARVKSLALLRSEVGALADRFPGIPAAPRFPAITVPARRETLIQASLVVDSVMFHGHGHIAMGMEKDADGLRSRRSYKEIAGTVGAAIIVAAGVRPWPALTEAQEKILDGRKRDAEAEQRDSTRFAAEGERALTRHGV